MKSKNCQKVVLKALGHILYGSNFIASDVTLYVNLCKRYQLQYPNVTFILGFFNNSCQLVIDN